MNKGILKKTEAGWFVLYQVMRDEITSGYDSIPLHPDSLPVVNEDDGKEVLFNVIVYPSYARYAKIINKDDLGCSYPDCICQGNEITDCKNRTPNQVNVIQDAIGKDAEKKKKVINGREVEYLDVVHHITITKFKMWDRIKILLGKKAVTSSELYTQHDRCKVVGSEAKTYVERLIPRKSVGMMHSPHIDELSVGKK